MDCFQNFLDFLKSAPYSFIFYCIRFAPRVLLACSGFELMLQMLNYLDENMLTVISRKNVSEDLDQIKTRPRQKSIANIISDNDDYNEEDILSGARFEEAEDRYSKRNTAAEISKISVDTDDYNNMSSSILVRFLLLNLPRYLLYILSLLFVRYSMYLFFLLFQSKTPSWKYFREILQRKFGHLSVLSYLFCVSSFDFLNLLRTREDPTAVLLGEYYWLMSNEVVFFLILSVTIFNFYKKRHRLDRLMLLIFISLIFLRFLYYLILKFFSVRCEPYYLSFESFGKFFLSPFNNFGFYALGAYFGVFFHVLQRRRDGISEDSPYKSIIEYIDFFANREMTKNNDENNLEEKKREGRVRMYNVCGVVIYPMLVIYLIAFIKVNSFIPNVESIVNFILLIDIDFFIYFIFWSLFIFCMIGDSKIIDFLSSSIWHGPNKIYLSFLSACIPSALYTVYMTDSLVLVSFFNVLFFGLVLVINASLIGTLLFAFLELPARRLLALALEESENKEIEETQLVYEEIEEKERRESN